VDVSRETLKKQAPYHPIGVVDNFVHKKWGGVVTGGKWQLYFFMQEQVDVDVPVMQRKNKVVSY